ncbi:MAG: serine/threonine-protein kinase [Planctomycetota bacterium]
MTTLPELPEELADRAAEELLAVTGPDRDQTFQSLLEAHPQYTAALQRLRSDLGGAEGLLDSSLAEVRREHATHIGGHRVIRMLGEGAFGSVYLCAQEQPVVRQVAVKVLRPGVGDQKTLRRFAAERQLLAALNHPAITQVFDAGVLPDGRPFFVMEFVDGVPMRGYCEARQLACRDRLRLFVELCRGVSHAHKRGIVHRDLKPANVLVLDSDHGPTPKIIDFGIAKALFSSDGDGGPRTDAGRVIGTPGYMSPEQAAGRSDTIDERADVFALGVMLYELLTGELPWAQGAAATDSEPVRPSARITTTTTAAPVAPLTQRRQLAAELRGDLDWITLKALAREREERYASVAAFAEDIERHLRGEPVSVGPPSVRYRLRKLVRRNRVAVASISSAVVLTGLGLTFALAYGNAAGAEVAAARKVAAGSLADATAVVERLLARSNDATLRDAPQGDSARQALLQDALSFYDRFLLDRPTEPDLRVGRCKALISLSSVHFALGESSRAQQVATDAVEEATAVVATDPTNVTWRGLLGESLRKQGRALWQTSNMIAAWPVLAAATTHLEACALADPVTYGRSYAAILREAADTLYEAQPEQSLAGKRAGFQVLEALRRDHPEIADLDDDYTQACLSVVTQLGNLRRFDEAASVLAKVADLPQTSTERNRLIALVQRQQARVTWGLGDPHGAIPHIEAAVAAATAWQLEQPHSVQPQDLLLRCLRELDSYLNQLDDFAASSMAFRRVIVQAEAMAQRFPDDPRQLAQLGRVLADHAQVLWDRFRHEDLDEAAACAARAFAIHDRIPPTVQVDRRPRWLLLALQAGIAKSLGKNAEAIWTVAETELPNDSSNLSYEERNKYALASCGLAHWHFVDGRNERALSDLALAREAIAQNESLSDRTLVQVGWIEAQIAGAAGEHAAAAAAADGILAKYSNWYGQRRAGDCLHLAWRCATAANATPEVIANYHARSAQLYDDAIRILRHTKYAQDPWHVLSLGFACVRAAELSASSGDRTQALELLNSALPKLEAVRETAHVDQWEDPIFQDGRALLEKLSADGR